MKTRIFNLIILDESGSMQLIKEEAINGVNETVQTILHAQQKHKEQEHFVSLVTFNIDTRTIWECIPATEIKEISRTDYYPNCSTALYDAMGMSLNALLPHVAPNDKILVTIVTDGEENASKEYTKLEKSSNNPLLNRAINATYPPASTFKVVNTIFFILSKFFSSSIGS